jgi:glycogen phosphorylase
MGTSIKAPGAEPIRKPIEQYGCGPVKFNGIADALYKRHLRFDDVVDVRSVDSRERFEAIARSVRDVLSQRWT